MGFGRVPKQNARSIEPATRSDREDFTLKDLKNESSNQLKWGLPLMLGGALAEIGESVGVLKDGEAVDIIKSINADAGRVFQQNEEGFKAAGALATTLVPILAVPKVIRAGGFLNSMLQKTKIGQAVAKGVITSGKNQAARIKSLGQEIKVFEQTKGIDITQDASLIAKIRAEKLSSFADQLKEGVAIDASIFAIGNEAEILFPSDSPMTNLALYTIPTGLFATAGFVFTGKALMRHIASPEVAARIAKNRNPLDIKHADVLSESGNRSTEAATASVEFNQATKDASEATSADADAVALARQSVAKDQLEQSIAKMGKDSVYGDGIDGSFNLPPGSGENKTIRDMTLQEPTGIVGATSVNPLTPSSAVEIPKQKQVIASSLQGKIDKLQDKLKAGPTNARAKLQTELDDLTQQRDWNDASRMHVVETDGSFVTLPERKWTVLDEPEKLKTRTVKEGVELTPDTASDVGMQMGFMNNGAFLQESRAAANKRVVGDGIDASSIIPDKKLNQESLDFAEASLDDLAINLSSATPKGKQFVDSLDDNIKGILSGKQRIAKATDIEIQTAKEAFQKAGLHKKLNKLADDKGMIPLYGTIPKNTGVTKLAIRGVEAKLVSVPVDDVVGIFNGAVIVDTKAAAIRPGKLERQTVLQSQADFAAQSLPERAAAWGLSQKFVDNYAFAKQGQMLMTEGRTFLELDTAAAVLQKELKAGTENDVVRWAANPELKGEDLLKELQYQSLIKKQEGYTQEKMAQIAINNQQLRVKVGQEQRISDHTFAVKYNLPSPTGTGKHPIVELFDAMIPQVGADIPKLSSIAKNLDAVEEQMAGLVVAGRLNEPRQTIKDFNLTGNSMRFDKDLSKKPAILMSNNRAMNRIGPDEVNKLISTQKIAREIRLANAANMNAPLNQLIYDVINASPTLRRNAESVPEIIQGTTTGRGIIGQQKRADEDIRAIASMDQMQDVLGRQALKFTQDEVFKPHQATFSALASHGNEGSLLSLNQGINELRNGWDVAEEAAEIGGGRRVLKLDGKSERNQTLYQSLFNRSLKEDIKAADEGYIAMPVRASVEFGSKNMPTPAVLDELAFQGLSSITDISHKFLNELNHLRVSKSLPPINKRNFHVPYYELKGDHVLHITDLEGKTVKVVSADTEGEAMRIARGDVKAFGDNGLRTSIQTQDFTQRYVVNAGGQFEAPNINFGFSGKQTGGIGGKSASPQINIGLDVLQNSIKQLQSNFASIPRYASSVIFEPQLNYAMRTKAALGSASATAKEQDTTLFDRYVRATLQTSSLTDKTALGKISYGIEAGADLMLAKLWDKFADYVPARTSASMREFNKFNDAVGGKEYNPFPDFTKFIERTNKVRIPPKIRNIHSKMANFTTAMVLRIADPGMPLVNFASVAAVSPVVMKALQRGANESFESWKFRTGIIGTNVTEDFIVPNTATMMSSAIHGLFDPEIRAARKLAKERGMFKQEVAEKIELITSPIEGYMSRMTSKTVDWLSAPTDWSEAMSREITFSMFYGIGKRTMGMTHQGDLVNFANKMASEVVGDYRSANRPEIFQASGMPFGLFTTWAWNFIQRSFGDLGSGRLGAAAMQGGIHSFLFGTESLPGYETATSILTSSYDGKRNIVDVMDDAWGPDAMNIVGSGLLGQIPRLMGSSDGFTIGQRSKIGLPAIFNPVGNDIIDMVPSAKVTKTLMEGFGRAINSIKQNNGISGREMAEIVQTNGVSGIAKFIATRGLGYSVDKTGQMVNADANSYENILASSFELQSLTEFRKRKEINRDRLLTEQKAFNSKQMNLQLRSLMRGGDISQDAMSGMITNAMEQGVSMQEFRNKVKASAIIGTISKSDRSLVQAIKRNDDEGRIARYLRFQDDSTE